MSASILIVEDHPAWINQLTAKFNEEFNGDGAYDIRKAETMQEALEVLNGQNVPSLVVLDLFIPAMKGGEESHVNGVKVISTIQRIREQGTPIKLLVITSHRERGKDYLALSKEWGVDGFYFKDIQTVDDLLMVSRVALEGFSETEVTRRLRQVLEQEQREKRRLQDDVAILKSVSSKAMFPRIYGMDEVLMRISEEIIDPYMYWRENPDRFAAAGMNFPSTVMLYGPPGTGKTEIARAIKAFFEGGNPQEKRADISSSDPDWGKPDVGTKQKIIIKAFGQVLKKVEGKRTIAVLIIDDVPIPRRNSDDDSAPRDELRRMTDAFNERVDEVIESNKTNRRAGKILIVLVSNYANPLQMDEATLDRFREHKFDILFPVENRKAVFRQIITEREYNISEELLAKLNKASSSINSGRDARGMVDKLINIAVLRQLKKDNPGQIRREIINADIDKLLATLSSRTLSHLELTADQGEVKQKEAGLREISSRSISLRQYLAEVEYQCLKDALEQTEGNKTKAAELLGLIDHSSFIRRMERVKRVLQNCAIKLR